MIPSSPALDAALARMEQLYGQGFGVLQLRADLLELRRLQHEASTAKPPAKVIDFDAARRLRWEMACVPDDPEAA